MTSNAAFWRKVIYLAVIGALLIPLYLIGHPASVTSTGEERPGGKLAQLRRENNLAQANLGDIDPASEAMKLSLLGARGVAANILWSQAIDYKTRSDFDRLANTLTQISRLQPNFISVWEYQAHNLSYNVSVEFDDYRQRYVWVKKGISFLIQGTHFNRDNPQLLYNLGLFMGQKIGRSDEQRQFRKLYREDADFQESMRPHIPIDLAEHDNWLTARLWFLRGQEVVDTGSSGVWKLKKTPLLFHAEPVKARINYAQALYNDFEPSEVAMRAWATSGNEWRAYGDRSIMTSWGHTITLNSRIRLEEEIADLNGQLDKLAPGVREKVVAENRAKLPPEQLQALDTPFEKRTGEQDYLAEMANLASTANARVIADRAPLKQRREASKLALTIAEKVELLRRVNSYRQQVNFDYWATRCDAEGTETMLKARQELYDAKQAVRDVRLAEAIEKFESSWKYWDEVFNEHPMLLEGITAEELVDDITIYSETLDQLDMPFPEPFILQDLIDLKAGKRVVPRGKRKPAASSATETNESAPETTPMPDAEEPTEAFQPEPAATNETPAPETTPPAPPADADTSAAEPPEPAVQRAEENTAAEEEPPGPG